MELERLLEDTELEVECSRTKMVSWGFVVSILRPGTPPSLAEPPLEDARRSLTEATQKFAREKAPPQGGVQRFL